MRLRRLFPEADYVTLDIPRDAASARLDPEGFLGRRCRSDRPYPLSQDGRMSAVPLGGPSGACAWIEGREM